MLFVVVVTCWEICLAALLEEKKVQPVFIAVQFEKENLDGERGEEWRRLVWLSRQDRHHSTDNKHVGNL